MLGRKSLGTPQMEVAPSSHSSPLRRRSVLLQKSATPNFINQNDDTAERMARRQEVSTPSISSIGGERRSLGLGQIPPAQLAENIAQCIKLYAQNKITVTNAFSLKIIDFMAISVRKQDGNMDNLHVASSSLDVSTKVYGCRVDSLYANALQVAGDKPAGNNDDMEQDRNSEQQDDDNEATGDENQNAEAAKKNASKKKKRNQRVFLKTADALKGNLELDRPAQLMMGEIDHQSSDTLDGAMLPLHVGRLEYSMAQFNGIVFDVIKESEDKEAPDQELPVPDVGDCSAKVIAESFRNFDFLNWNLDEEEQMEVDENNDPSQDPNAFHFDPDGSLPTDNEPQGSFVNFFDLQEEQVNVNANANAAQAREDIVDFRGVIVSSGNKRNPEYSYLQNSIKLQLVGPSHWKVRGLAMRPANTMKETEIISKQAKKKKDVELDYDLKQKEEYALKFDKSKATKRLAKIRGDTWTEMRNMCPYDNVDEDDEDVFYLRPDIKYPSSDNPERNTLNTSDDPHYDYDNPHDVTNFCPNVQDEDNYHGEDNRSPDPFENELCTQGALVGDNLIAMPTLPNTNNIQFAQRAKKIDMKHLKKSIWRSLTTNKKNTDKENFDIQSAVEQTENKITIEKSFVEDVYKELPNYLSQSSASSLSLPIAFVSLLHLTNEKCLDLAVTPMMDDLTIKKN